MSTDYCEHYHIDCGSSECWLVYDSHNRDDNIIKYLWRWRMLRKIGCVQPVAKELLAKSGSIAYICSLLKLKTEAASA